MHTQEHTYTCDQCGDIQTFASSHDFPTVHLVIEPFGQKQRPWNFCSRECQLAFLKEHGFEVKE